MTLKARQIPGQECGIECGSRQIIQARPGNPEWSLLAEAFQLIYQVAPTADLFAMRFVSPVPNPVAWAVMQKAFQSGVTVIMWTSGHHLSIQ